MVYIFSQLTFKNNDSFKLPFSTLILCRVWIGRLRRVLKILIIIVFRVCWFNYILTPTDCCHWGFYIDVTSQGAWISAWQIMEVRDSLNEPTAPNILACAHIHSRTRTHKKNAGRKLQKYVCLLKFIITSPSHWKCR